MEVSTIASVLLKESASCASVADFLSSVLAEVSRRYGGKGLAVVRPLPPSWSIVASAGLSQSEIPWDLAAEVLEHDLPLLRDNWQAVPLVADPPGTTASEPLGAVSDVLVMAHPLAEDGAGGLGDELAAALRTVRRQQQAQRRIRRLEKMLEITHAWQQAHEMEVLLTRMAEASTDLLDADRASIFLWDKKNRLLVGRPALGVDGNELRLPDDAGIVGQVVQSGQTRRVDNLDAAEIDRTVDKGTGYKTNTILCVPLVSSTGQRMGAFEVLNKHQGQFTAEDERELLDLSACAATALENTQQLEDLLVHHEQLVEQVAEQVELVGKCSPIEALRATTRRVADTDLAILILGENGTGKEVIARSMHYQSQRRTAPFVAINCAALSETLLESELFGHEKGAFTDAHESRAGKFEIATGGTLFLDEIGDMSLSGQAKLLRVLEEKTVVRIGGATPIYTDVRILAATNQNLADLLEAGRFREDLYFRLNVVSVELPPLRERGEDIFLLADHFMTGFCRNIGKSPPKFTAAARKRLAAHLWPGNVRELRNLMERLAYLSPSEMIDADELSFILSPRKGPMGFVDADLTLNDATQKFQQSYIQQTIQRTLGNVSDAARLLGVHRSNLYRKMRQLGMETGDET
jgi:transcriptional regulator with GAF, ATPase, and Fis domain